MDGGEGLSQGDQRQKEPLSGGRLAAADDKWVVLLGDRATRRVEGFVGALHADEGGGQGAVELLALGDAEEVAAGHEGVVHGEGVDGVGAHAVSLSECAGWRRDCRVSRSRREGPRPTAFVPKHVVTRSAYTGPRRPSGGSRASENGRICRGFCHAYLGARCRTLVGEVRWKKEIRGTKVATRRTRGPGGDPKNAGLSHRWDGRGGYFGTTRSHGGDGRGGYFGTPRSHGGDGRRVIRMRSLPRWGWARADSDRTSHGRVDGSFAGLVGRVGGRRQREPFTCRGAFAARTRANRSHLG